LSYGEYYAKFLRRFFSELLAPWKNYRWLFTISPILVVTGLSIYRGGVRGLIQSFQSDPVTNSLTTIVLVVSALALINIVRTPKLLGDDGLVALGLAQTTISNQSARIEQLETVPNRSPQETHHYQEAAKHLEKLSPDAKAVLRVIALNGRLVGGQVPQIGEVSNDKLWQIINSGILGSLVVRSSVMVSPSEKQPCWSIIDGYRSPLADLLYPPQSD
jgi:hypothetical protein